MEIRKIELKDLDEVFEVLNELYDNKIKYDIFSKIYKEKLEDKNAYYIIAIEDNIIVGVQISEITHQMHRAKKSSFIEES